MENSWLVTPSACGCDLKELSRKLEKSWETFVTYRDLETSRVRNVIGESWRRCEERGINPQLLRAMIVLTDDELAEIRMKNELIQVSEPYLRLLADIIEGTNHLVVLCDAKGRILQIYGNEEVKYRASEMNFVCGADWSEQGAGTNAIGTAISINKPVQVFAAEHFCRGWHGWTCSATPIRDPVTRELIGVLDLTGYRQSHQPHSLGIVVAQANAIEKELLKQDILKQQQIMEAFIQAEKDYSTDGIIALDSRGRIIQVNEKVSRVLAIDTRELVGQPAKKLLNNIYTLSREVTEQRIREKEIKIEEQCKLSGYKATAKMVERNGNPIGALVIVRRSKRCPVETRPHNFSAKYTFQDIICEDETFKETLEMAKEAAKSEATILILGESGTGKELVAQAIHTASSRRYKPFVSINCGAIPKELIGSELFGYVGGAFTGASKNGNPGKFELANGGTIFLDEIGEMSLEEQVNFLRVLEERELVRIGGKKVIPVDVRVIAATNKDLMEEVKAGHFRVDLYYRLNVITLRIPPLRERKKDIPSLVEHFLDEFGASYYKVDPEVINLFMNYDWPGNVRELKNVIHRMVVLANEPQLRIDQVPRELMSSTPADTTAVQLGPVERAEKDMLLEIIRECEGNISLAARKLGVARSTLYRKIKKYNIS
ncbi:sigma-54-dependent Fis family transcriptional regulator [Calderihabitans maritimus]|uniref:Sigma-54 specific transcriptional regulator n=1 Tax=Calderihabitans maritimus TaxID=1246530 RepID=A0A1Z5HTX4_9FIRM|nr:sigma-54-dependent Fis family transcriptional regulator [Calderihabitans maritimus]GAW92983.1 sigma-54 specific transcriptional regulator [Calderihabitans maritimus]